MPNDQPLIGAMIRSGEFYDQIYQFVDDIPFYKKWSGTGPVLELCAGTGRVSLPIAQSGIDVTGVDFTPSMLEQAVAKSKALNSTAKFELGDIRTFDLKRQFPVILLPFNSLEDFYTSEAMESVFRTVKAHAQAETLFIFDVNNPNIANLYSGKRAVPLRTKFDLNGKHVEINERMSYDAARQINRVIRTYTIDGVSTKHPLDLRVYFPCELDSLLKYNGFQVIKKFGDFAEGLFTSHSAKQIYVCKVL